MKILFSLLVSSGLLLTGGCCTSQWTPPWNNTPESVAKLKGQGTMRSFDVGFNCAWTTVRSVAVMDDLNILKIDRSTGFISARRPMGETTFGDVFAIWIRPISPTETEVEVVSRRVGPPVPFAPDEEESILKSLEDVLTF
jgi:hypothetical protein